MEAVQQTKLRVTNDLAEANKRITELKTDCNNLSLEIERSRGYCDRIREQERLQNERRHSGDRRQRQEDTRNWSGMLEPGGHTGSGERRRWYE